MGNSPESRNAVALSRQLLIWVGGLPDQHAWNGIVAGIAIAPTRERAQRLVSDQGAVVRPGDWVWNCIGRANCNQSERIVLALENERE